MVARRSPRRPAAILATDVVGYSRLMRDDEAGTLNRLKALQSELIRPLLRTHGGRLVETTGDGALIELATAVDAVQYAVELQRELVARNEPDGAPPGLQLRIGINLGGVVVEAGDLFGDGVNMAARLEALAKPGEICVSAMVYEAVRYKRTVEFVDLGQKIVKGFSEPIRVYAAVGEGKLTAAATPPPALYGQPAVAVLPFDNFSGDPDQAHFADGLSEDIITALSLWRSFPVISRNSTFAYKGQARDIRKIAAELDARYVLEGSVRRVGDRLRVTAQLSDASSGHHVWAHKYDCRATDIFDLQDDLTGQIVRVVAPAVLQAEQHRLLRSRPQSLDAWECVQRGMTHLHGYDLASTREFAAVVRARDRTRPDLQPRLSRPRLQPPPRGSVQLGRRAREIDREVRPGGAAGRGAGRVRRLCPLGASGRASVLRRERGGPGRKPVSRPTSIRTTPTPMWSSGSRWRSWAGRKRASRFWRRGASAISTIQPTPLIWAIWRRRISPPGATTGP